METLKQYELPMYWCCALINGDFSGLDDDTLEELRAWQRDNPQTNIVSCCNNSYMGRYDGLVCDMLTYYSLEG